MLSLSVSHRPFYFGVYAIRPGQYFVTKKVNGNLAESEQIIRDGT